MWKITFIVDTAISALTVLHTIIIIISLHLNSTHGLFFSDLKHICQNLNQFGYGKGTKHGGLSEYTVIPAKYAYLLKTDLDDSRAAILERELTM